MNGVIKKRLQVVLLLFLFCLVAFLLTTATDRGSKESKQVNVISKELKKNYATHMKEYIKKMNQSYVSLEGLVFIVSSIVLEEDGMILEYSVKSASGRPLPKYGVLGITLNSEDLQGRGEVILHTEETLEKGETSLAIISFEGMSLASLVGKEVQMTAEFLYVDEKPKDGVAANYDHVTFTFQPDQIYKKRQIPVANQISLLGETIEVQTIAIHPLYTEVILDVKDGDMVIGLEARDEQNKDLITYSLDNTKDLIRCYFTPVKKEETRIYLRPMTYRVKDSKNKNSLELKKGDFFPILLVSR